MSSLSSEPRTEPTAKGRSASPGGWRRSGAAAFGAFLTASVLCGVGSAEVGTSFDGIGYGLLGYWTWVTTLCLAVVLLPVVALTRAKLRGAFGYSVSAALVVAAPIPTVLIASLLLPMHYTRVCDTAEARHACEAATWEVRQSCRPDERCFSRIEKACSLGSEASCRALIEGGYWSRREACEALEARCALAESCLSSPTATSAVCESDGLPRIERLDPMWDCRGYEDLCEFEALAP